MKTQKEIEEIRAKFQKEKPSVEDSKKQGYKFESLGVFLKKQDEQTRR